MDENIIVLWNQTGEKTTFEKLMSIEIDSETYIILSPIESDIYYSDDKIFIFKIKDSEDGELLVRLKDKEYLQIAEQMGSVFEKIINNNKIENL